MLQRHRGEFGGERAHPVGIGDIASGSGFHVAWRLSTRKRLTVSAIEHVSTVQYQYPCNAREADPSRNHPEKCCSSKLHRISRRTPVVVLTEPNVLFSRTQTCANEANLFNPEHHSLSPPSLHKLRHSMGWSRHFQIIPTFSPVPEATDGHWRTDVRNGSGVFTHSEWLTGRPDSSQTTKSL